MEKMMHTGAFLLVLAIAGTVTVAIMTGGCKTAAGSPDIAMGEDDGAPHAVASGTDAPKQAGALLWSQNCMRCHTLRNPNEKSDREWNIIMHHMRVRANLTAEEHRLILAFLQSAN